MTPAIFGVSGPALTPDERALFAAADPVGYILFARNCVDRAQMRALTDDLRDIHGRADLPILIDQEGGRVVRMKPPEWPAFPAGGAFNTLYARAPMSAIAAVRANAAAIGATLAEVGVNVDCMPLLDVVSPATTDAIGDRAFGSDPMQVAALGRATIEGLRAAGVVAVMKHMPGHGRARVDSHHVMPVVEAGAAALEADIAPFRTLADAPMGMTAHLLYPAWDADRPATVSPTIIQDVIRGRIGFDGLLMTDDIDMKALSGTAAEKGARALAAGCDVVLDCWASIDQMTALAETLPAFTAAGRARLDRAMATIAETPATPPLAELLDTRDRLLALA